MSLQAVYGATLIVQNAGMSQSSCLGCAAEEPKAEPEAADESASGCGTPPREAVRGGKQTKAAGKKRGRQSTDTEEPVESKAPPKTRAQARGRGKAKGIPHPLSWFLVLGHHRC